MAIVSEAIFLIDRLIIKLINFTIFIVLRELECRATKMSQETIDVIGYILVKVYGKCRSLK